MGKKTLAGRLVRYSLVIFALYIVMTVGAYVQAKQTARSTGFEFGIDYRILYTAGQTALAGDADQIYDSPSQNARILRTPGLKYPKIIIGSTRRRYYSRSFPRSLCCHLGYPILSGLLPRWYWPYLGAQPCFQSGRVFHLSHCHFPL